jgi:hypothetical protein
MSFVVVDRMGSDEEDASRERLATILGELDKHDPYHPDAWLTHESGWTLTAHECGVLIWHHDESAPTPRHLAGLPRTEILVLWLALAEGRIEDVEHRPWRPGNGIPSSWYEERAAIARAVDREFYDSLGAERPGTTCASPGCARGTVRMSLFCRQHQFENVRRRPCPFTD